MIRIKDLRVDYDDLCAVNDLSLEVGPGEVCGLIGPNGAGKTTTMRAMLGLIEPTYGEIEVMGVDVRERPKDVCRIVGFMPDFPPVYEDLMVWEFLDLFAASYGLDRSQRRHAVADHLDMVGLTEKREAMVVELSRGMRQRMMLAKTLIPEPARPPARRAGQRHRPPGPHRPQEHPPPARRGEEDGPDLLAHPGRDERVLHVGRDHGEGPGRRQRPDRRGQPAGHGRLVPVGRGAGRARAVPLGRRRRRSGRRDRARGQGHLRVPVPRRRPGRQRAAGDPGAAGRAHLGFARTRDNLEDLFLKVGSKELS